MRTTLAGLVITLSIGGAAHAAILYDSFGPGDVYDTSSGWTIGGGSRTETGGFSQALQFMPSLSANVSTVEVALFSVQGGSQVIGMLMTDAGGLPGSVLETFSFVNVVGDPTIYLAASSAHASLQAGTPYWFALTAPDLVDDEFGWNRNVNPPFVPNAQRVGSGPWVLDSPDYRGTLRVTGVEAPEPASWKLVASALAALAFLPRRSGGARSGVRSRSAATRAV